MTGYAYYNDNDPYCCKVLRKNIAQGNLPGGVVDERDIRDIHAADFMAFQHVHLFAGIGGFPLGMSWAGFPFQLRTLTGGFPCQDLSVAGRQAGLQGERSGLWSEVVRLLKERNELEKPFDYILIENVRNLLSGGDYEKEEASIQSKQNDTLCSIDTGDMGNTSDDPLFLSWMGTLLADMAACGYDAEWTCLRASDFGAPHIRERVFIVAYSQSNNEGWMRIRDAETFTRFTCNGQDVAYSDSKQSQRRGNTGKLASTPGTCQSSEKEWQRLWNSPNDSGETLAYATSQRLPFRRYAVLTTSDTQARTGMDTESERCSQGVGQADTYRQGLEIRNGSATTPETRATTAGSDAGATQSPICRVFNGLSRGMDRYQWPARPGEQQHEWEPSRVVTEKQSQRVNRLKALGNAIVPQCAEYVARCIMAAIEQEEVSA